MSRSGVQRLGLWVLVVMIWGVLVSDATAKPAEPGLGNSPSAQQCQKRGWQNLVGSDGTAFGNAGACTSYAAKGGQLSLKPPPPPLTPGIFLAYVDTVAPDFETPDIELLQPWGGDPNVIFLGCTDAVSCGGEGFRHFAGYNGGAIRIDNPEGSPRALTLTNAYVDIGVCHLEPWGALLPATAAPGQSLILTQTGLFGPPLPEACNRDIVPTWNWNYWNFYTSGTPNDAPGDFVCGTAQVLSPPIITLVFSDGTTLTVTDADEVLNTGGINGWACMGRSQSTPWMPVASTNIVRTP